MDVQINIKALADTSGLDKARKSLGDLRGEALKPLPDNTKQLRAASEDLAASTRKAYEELRTVPEKDIRQKIDNLKAAYAELADSGTASASDLSRAYQSMQSQVASLESAAAGGSGGSVGSIASKLSQGLGEAITQLSATVAQAYSLLTEHAAATGAGLVGLGLLSKRVALTIADGFAGAFSGPLAAAGSAIASTGAALLGFIGKIYLAIKAFELLGGIIDGTAFNNERIEALLKQVESYDALAQSLGVTTTEAQALADALEVLAKKKSPITADSFKKIQTDLRSNVNQEDGNNQEYGAAKFEAIGVKGAKDLSDVDLLQQTAQALAKYTDEQERAAAATSVGITNVAGFLQVMSEVAAQVKISEEELQQYNLVVGQDGAEALSRYEEAVAKFSRNGSLTTRGFSQVIADVMIPILTDLAVLFKDGLPGAVVVFRVVLSSAAALVQTFGTGMVIVLGTIRAAAIQLVAVLDTLGRVAASVLAGDFSGAAENWKRGLKVIKDVADDTFADIERSVAKTNAAIKLAVEGGGGGGDAKPPPDLSNTTEPSTRVPKKLPSRRTDAAAELALQKALIEAEYSRLEAVVKAGEAVIERAFADNQIGSQVRLNARLESLNTLFEATRKKLAAEIVEVEVAQAKLDKTKPEDLAKFKQFEAQKVQIKLKLDILPLGFAEEQAKLRSEFKKQMEALDAVRVSIRVRFSAISGEFDRESVTKQVQQQLKAERDRLTAEFNDARNSGDEATAVGLAADLKKLDIIQQTTIAQAALASEYQKIGLIQNDLSAKEQAVEVQKRRGQISELEATAQIKGLRANATSLIQEKIVLLEKEIATTLELNKAQDVSNFVTEQTQKITALRQQLESLKDVAVDLGQKFTVAFQNNIGSSILSVLDGTKSLSQAFRDMLKNIVQQILSSNINSLLSSLFTPSGGGASSGVGNALSGLGSSLFSGITKLFGFADGGHIGGPRAAPGADNQIIAVGGGEYILKQNAVDKINQRYGSQFLDYINANGKLPGFAAGGLVNIQKFASGGRVAATPQPAAAAPTSVSIQVVNNGTPQRVTDQKYDAQANVVRVVMEDIRRGGPISGAIESASRRR